MIAAPVTNGILNDHFLKTLIFVSLLPDILDAYSQVEKVSHREH